MKNFRYRLSAEDLAGFAHSAAFMPEIARLERHLQERAAELLPAEYAAICGPCGTPGLGDLCAFINRRKLSSKIFRRRRFRFEYYCAENLRYAIDGNDPYDAIYPHKQVAIALRLFRSIRNTACHGGDLRRSHRRPDGSTAPAIFTQELIGETLLNFGVMPDKIARFLSDLSLALAASEYETQRA